MSNAELADFEFEGKAGKEPSVAAGLVAPALAWALVLAALAIAGPVEGGFRDHGVQVSPIMKLIVYTSNLWLVPAIVVGFILLVHYKVLEELARLKDGRIHRRIWSAMMVALPLLILGFMLTAAGLPLISLITKFG